MECRRELPPGARASRRYCSDRCRMAAMRRRQALPASGACGERTRGAAAGRPPRRPGGGRRSPRRSTSRARSCASPARPGRSSPGAARAWGRRSRTPCGATSRKSCRDRPLPVSRPPGDQRPLLVPPGVGRGPAQGAVALLLVPPTRGGRLARARQVATAVLGVPPEVDAVVGVAGPDRRLQGRPRRPALRRAPAPSCSGRTWTPRFSPRARARAGLPLANFLSRAIRRHLRPPMLRSREAAVKARRAARGAAPEAPPGALPSATGQEYGGGAIPVRQVCATLFSADRCGGPMRGHPCGDRCRCGLRRLRERPRVPPGPTDALPDPATRSQRVPSSFQARRPPEPVVVLGGARSVLARAVAADPCDGRQPAGASLPPRRSGPLQPGPGREKAATVLG